MASRKRASRRSVKSDLARVDAHVIQPGEYRDLPELGSKALARGVFRKAGKRVTLGA